MKTIREGDIDGSGLGKRTRSGRPPGSRAGEVDTRILDAATQLFLQRGYEGTSCDQVAIDAHAGKASIYARYANKEALFAAVIENSLERTRVLAEEVIAENPLLDRLTTVGMSLIEEALEPNALALMRLFVSEAPRFPEIAASADRTVLQHAVRRVAAVIAARDPDTIDTVDRAMAEASKFVDLAIFPLLFRALLGENPDALRISARRRIKDSIAMLTATGSLQGLA